MSHAAAQIMDWFKVGLTGVAGLPDAVLGMPKQIPPDTNKTVVSLESETIENPSVLASNALQPRTLVVVVSLLSRTYDSLHVLCVLAEEAIATHSGFPGERFELVTRTYEEYKETDRDYITAVMNYSVQYLTVAGDVETFT